MTEFRVGNITCQVAGQVVPVAEFTLAEGHVIFFEQHTLLWKERTVSLTGKNLKAAGQRIDKLASMLHGGPGMYLDRFAAGDTQGLPRNASRYAHRFLLTT